MYSLTLFLTLLSPYSGGLNPADPQAKPAQQPPAQTGPAQKSPPPPLPMAPTEPQTTAPKVSQVDGKPLVDDGGVIVQSRGPLHEAYAQPIDQNPTPTTVIPKAPPPPVPELPPSEKPAGANVQWIPGYWGWDPEKNDFLWVSGLWRNMPPDRKWTPGYWNKAGDGWQWTSGFWGDAKGTARYQPEPPDSLEQGPSQPAPGQNYFYIPGAWVQQDGKYVWRPGFWYPAQQDWVYVAPHYNYTPAGAVYIDGYWDYPLADRGTAYAPVVFNQPYWNDPGWYYQPNYGLDLGFGFGGPFNTLFVGAGRRHYFFGDYFAPHHFRNGFNPWYAYGARNYDPLFSYYHWSNRFNPGWYGGLHNNFWARVNNPALRPPTTFGQTRALAARGGLAPGGVTPFPVRTGAGSTRGNVLQTSVARQLHSPAQARAVSEQRAALASGLTPRPAGGPSTIAAGSAIGGNSGKILPGSVSTAGQVRGLNSTSGVNRTPTGNLTAASAGAVKRGPINYQSFYSGPSRTAPTPLYQAQARMNDGLANGSLQAGPNVVNGRSNQALNMGRAYMGAYSASPGSRGVGGYAPSMSGFSSRGVGGASSSGAMHMSGAAGHVSSGGGHVSGGGGTHGGGGHK